ncbi:hypothetical protein [Parasphingorhabdus sp.]
MTNVNINNQVAAAFAAFISATIFLTASIGPAVNNSASLVI